MEISKDKNNDLYLSYYNCISENIALYTKIDKFDLEVDEEVNALYINVFCERENRIAEI